MLKEIDCTSEVWKAIEGFEGLYEVSNWGRIKSLPKEILAFGKDNPTKEKRGELIMRPCINRQGYMVINLSKNGTNMKFSVHRLVAMAFVPNPNNYPIVNHKDENPCNNRADNLEWCTHQYNVNYGTARQRAKETVRRNQELCNEQWIKSYEERKAYAEYLNNRSISNNKSFWTPEMIAFVPDAIRDKLRK